MSTPLAGRYPAEAAQALLGLAPFLVLSTAVLLVMPAQMGDLHADMTGLQLAQGSPRPGTRSGWWWAPTSSGASRRCCPSSGSAR